jgi:hypothetical protein
MMGEPELAAEEERLPEEGDRVIPPPSEESFSGVLLYKEDLVLREALVSFGLLLDPIVFFVMLSSLQRKSDYR